MAIPNKPSDKSKLFVSNRIFKDPPQIPTEYSKTAMSKYASEHRVWWADTLASLYGMAGDIAEIQARINAMPPAP